MRRLFVMPLLAALTVCAASPAAASEFEVWLVDQSNSTGKSYGGAIYIYDGENLMGEDAAVAPASTIDLGGATSGLDAVRGASVRMALLASGALAGIADALRPDSKSRQEE